MRVDGIFLDETPSTYDADSYAYLQTASLAIRNASKFADRFVAHNPGLVSPTLLNSPTVLQNSYLNLTDLTIIYEETFDNWLDKSVMGPLQAQKLRRKNLAVLLHSLPDVTDEVLEFVVQQVEDAADWVFLTNATDNYYHDFSPMFGGLVKAVNAG